MVWSRVSALPRRPAAYKAAALLAELTRRALSLAEIGADGKGFGLWRWGWDCRLRGTVAAARKNPCPLLNFCYN